MKYLALGLLFISISFHTACDEVGSFAGLGDVTRTDPLITEEDANAQNFDLTTPEFGMQVSIRDDVQRNVNSLLNSLDEMAADFLECQFMMGADIGFQDFDIGGGNIVPQLSDLRVFVVPFNFECEAVDRNVCAGIHFGRSDLIVISVRSFSRCDDLPFWKHELGHRYGMAANHNNQAEFEPCIDPPECDFEDIFDFGIGG